MSKIIFSCGCFFFLKNGPVYFHKQKFVFYIVIIFFSSSETFKCSFSKKSTEVVVVATKIAQTNVKKEKGYLYFVDKEGDVSRAKMARGGEKGGKPEKVARASITKEPGMLYFVDKDGDIGAAKMARGRKK